MFKGAEQPSLTGEKSTGGDDSKKYHVLRGGVVLEERNPGPDSFGSDTLPLSAGSPEGIRGTSAEHSVEVGEQDMETLIQELFPDGLDEDARERVVSLLETAMQELVPENPAVDPDGKLVLKDEVVEPVLVTNDSSKKTGLAETLLAKIRQHPKAYMFLNAVALFGALSTQSMPEAKAGNRAEIKQMYRQADDQYQKDMANFSINNRRDELMRYQNWERDIQMEQLNKQRDARMLSHAAVQGFEQSCKTFSGAIDRIKSDYELGFLKLSSITDPKARNEAKRQLDFATMERIVREENAFKESSLRVERDVRSSAAEFGRGEQRRAEEYITQYKDVKTLRMLLPSVKFRLLLQKELEGMGAKFEKSVLRKEAEARVIAREKEEGLGSRVEKERKIPAAQEKKSGTDERKTGAEKSRNSQDDAFFRALMGK
ncbi:MAG: hypothetical protein HGB37_02770 [Candidatus Moranbacteria bacterium]|nr:hypothetical protein [Candidatus Moranbacteria bacterium]